MEKGQDGPSAALRWGAQELPRSICLTAVQPSVGRGSEKGAIHAKV